MGFIFEKFTETDSSFASRVTVRRTGQIGFNTGAINSHRIRDFDFCVLYFDQVNRVVGLEMEKAPCEGAVPIKKSDANTYIRAKNFCDRYSIDYTRSHRYDLKKDPQTGYLYFELDREQTADEEGEEDEQAGTG